MKRELSHNTSVRFDPAMYKDLQAIAEEQASALDLPAARDVSWIIRKAVREYIERWKASKQEGHPPRKD